MGVARELFFVIVLFKQNKSDKRFLPHRALFIGNINNIMSKVCDRPALLQQVIELSEIFIFVYIALFIVISAVAQIDYLLHLFGLLR